jgi:hypothetical protein
MGARAVFFHLVGVRVSRARDSWPMTRGARGGNCRATVKERPETSAVVLGAACKFIVEGIKFARTLFV